MAHFICTHQEPVFFIVELPSKQDKETEVSHGIVNELHKDVYYIDGCSKEEALDILNRVGKMLIDDGLSAFGFGGHESQDEIMFGKYNVATLSQSISKYPHFFEEHNIAKNDNLVLAWDTFSK